MIKLSDKSETSLIKRVRQIAAEIDSDFVGEYKEMSLDSFAFRLKQLAINYNCYINSWLSGNGDAVAEAYCAEDYEEEDEDTWELLSSSQEPIAICMAFKWLSDKQYFKES
jgi:hypothetical protein